MTLKLKPGALYQTLTITGFKNNQAKVEVHKILHEKSKENIVKYPQLWENVQDLEKKKVMIIDVGQGSQEWNEIDQEFKKTMPKATITKVQRVQNTFLWNTF